MPAYNPQFAADLVCQMIAYRFYETMMRDGWQPHPKRGRITFNIPKAQRPWIQEQNSKGEGNDYAKITELLRTVKWGFNITIIGWPCILREQIETTRVRRRLVPGKRSRRPNLPKPIPDAELDKVLRTKAKTMNLGTTYAATHFDFAKAVYHAALKVQP